MKINKAAVLILSLFFLGIYQLFTQNNNVPPVKFEKISDNLYQIVGGRGANGGAFIGDDAVLLIEAKMDENSVKQTLEELSKITQKPIMYLVSTHSDGDHINGNKFFPKTITFIAHENCRKEFFTPQRDGLPSEWSNPELLPFIPSITFRDKMDIYLGSKKVELWYFGIGHTTGDAVVYFPEEKTAFLGDQIFVGRPQLIHSYKGGNSFEHVKTLTKMLQILDALKFCSGHAEIIDRQTIEIHLQQMIARQEKIKEYVNQGKTLEEIRSGFEENESRLVETIFEEIKSGNF